MERVWSYERTNSDELCHYGVKGMRWGVRRFTDSNGRLTSEGRNRYKQFKQDIRKENKKAFELGRSATIIGKALERSNKKLLKLDAAGKKSKLESDVNKKLRKDYSSAEKAAKKHLDSLKKKYGKENVKGLTFDKKTGRIHTRTASKGQIAASVGASVLGLTVPALLGSPVGFAAVPRSSRGLGKDYYKTTKKKIVNKKYL